MAKYSRKSNSEEISEVPDWPSECMRCKQNATDIVLAIGKTDKNQRSGPASSIMTTKQDDEGNKIRKVKQGCEFSRWVTRCTKCYMTEMHGPAPGM